jgi:CRISPR-associated exonuclease Cas4
METPYAEADLLPLSGLAHMAFCERRWALVHLEQQWEDNRFTAEGDQLHEKAHSQQIESRPGVLIRRTLPLRSFRLGLSGQADIVEFLPSTEADAISLAGRRGRWQPFPVEYKRSRDKAGSIAYRLQLCAQAMCLEEMLGARIPSGAVYDGSTRRRQPVEFSQPVRNEVERLVLRMHQLRRDGCTPQARRMPACRNCSMAERCLPELLDGTQSVAAYMQRMTRTSAE